MGICIPMHSTSKAIASKSGCVQSKRPLKHYLITWAVANSQKKNTKKSSSTRLFLALWPNGNERKQIKELQDSIGLSAASPVKLENLHITLHFLGDVDKSDISMLLLSLENISNRPITLTLDRLGYFSKPNILWLGATHPPDTLTNLVKNTKNRVRSVINNYHQKNFIPHVTLFRKAQHLPEVRDMPHINLKFDSFVLVESVMQPEGVKYSLLQEWSLD